MEEEKVEEVLTTKERVEKVKKETEKLINMDQVKELIKNNVKEFEHGGIKYRTKKPNFEQKYTVNNEQSKKYIEMLKDTAYALESDLIKIYKDRGIDIEGLDTRFQNIQKEKEEIDKKLGKALEDKLPESDCEILAEEIKKLQAEQQTVMMEKSVLLNDSLESKLNVYSYTYLAYLITEKNISEDPEKPNWIKPWKNYDEFIKEDESLVNVLVWFTMFVARDEIKSF